MTWTRNYMYNLVRERQEEIESIDDKEKLSPDMLSMLLTVNTGNNEKPMTCEEIGDNVAEILIEGVDSVCIIIYSIFYFYKRIVTNYLFF